jgi:hypothetical protein
MAARNDITGDAIQTRGTLSPEGEAAFDRIFGVKKKEKYIPPPLPLDEYPNNGVVSEEPPKNEW